MADLITGNTQLTATKEAIIASIVQKELNFAAKLLNAGSVTDYSGWAVKGAKSVSVPKSNSFTAVDRASGVAGDASVITFGADLIDLNQAAYVAWIVDSQDEVQSRISVQAELARLAASAQGRFVDSYLIALLEAGAAATTTAGDITKDIVLEMRETLLSGYADPNQLFLTVGPDQEAKLLNIAEFVRADSYGAMPTALKTGVIGQLYGVNVIVSMGVAASTYYMWEKSGLAIAFQQGPMMSEQGANEYGSQAKRVALDQLFGAKLMQTGLYVKDNN